MLVSTTKNHETYKETRKYDPYTRKQHPIVSEKTQIRQNILDKNFKTPILSMFKELKGTMSKELKKSMRRMNHQVRLAIEIINNEPNRNSGVEKYNS